MQLQMPIDERLWPLPNAFNIREGSPFGRDEKFVAAMQLAEKNAKNGAKTRSKKAPPHSRTTGAPK